MHIERIDPLDLDLDVADEIAAITADNNTAAGAPIPAPTGPTVLRHLQLQSDNRPVDGLWLAYEGDTLVGRVVLQLPDRENLDSAYVSGGVRPDHHRRGVGRALMDTVLEHLDGTDRRKVYSGAVEGGSGVPALEAMGFKRLAVNAIRRIDVHGTTSSHWDRLYADAAEHAADYELQRMVAVTPEDRLEDLVALHDAINDAPLSDPDSEPDVWDADRVRTYDQAMAGRSQTVYRVLARHRTSGEWAGMSILCVDEFAPGVAFQEDTSVVRAHRGHRLGLLMKTEMLRWITDVRPEVGATDTWNDTTNHHMIAVNEALGAQMIARHIGYRLER